jgi:hypothetical protein
MTDKSVGKFAKFTDGIWREVTDGSPGVPLYAAPRPWVGLTYQEVVEIMGSRDWTTCWSDVTYTRAVEAKLKEKNK